VLKRKQELAELALQLEELEALGDNLSVRQTVQETELSSLERRRETLSRTIAERQREYAELRSRVSASRMQIEQFAARRTRAEDELAEIRQQQQLEQEGLGEARVILQDALDAMETDTRQRETLLTERDQARNSLDSARQRARHTRDRLHELSMRERSVSTQLQAVKEGLGRLEIQVARLQERRDQLLASVNLEEDPTEELTLQLEEQLEKRLLVERRLAQARVGLEEVEHGMREHEK